MNKKTLFLSLIGLIFGILLLFLPKNGRVFDEKSFELYLQGIEFAQKNDFQNAYYNFGKVRKYSYLYPLAVYRQALCADSLNDNNTSIKKYKKFLKLSNDISFAPAVFWQLGEAYRREGSINSAKKIYKKLIKKYPTTDFARASEYRLAEIADKNNVELKKRYYVKYLEDAPIGRFSSLALDELKNYELTLRDKIVIANSYYEKNDLKSALSILDNIEDNDSYLLKGKIYLKNNDKENARANFYKYLKTLNKEDGENINFAIDSYVKTHKNFVVAYEELMKIENPYSILGVYFNYAQDLNNQKSTKLYEKIIKRNPQSYFAPESTWELFWRAYKTKNYSLALKYVDSHTAQYKNKNSSPKILYFAGKIHLNLRHRKTADKYFNRVLSEYPDSYYAFRAQERLSNIINQFSKLPNKKLNYKKQLKFKTNSALLDTLIVLDDIEAINSLKLQDEFIKSYIAYKRGNRSYSIVLARDEMSKIYPKPDKHNSNWQLVYPIYYGGEIERCAKLYNYNPALILAITKEESFFDANAKSSAGAYGLMQIVPTTASEIVGRKVTPQDLTNPDFNIQAGVKYISALKNDFNNEMLAIASYNAGLGNVKKWKSKFYNGDYDDFVEEIPFLETKTYVKKVFSSFWNYQRIY